MSVSSDDAPIGCVKWEDFVVVGRSGFGGNGSSFGIGVGVERCQLCYFVVIGPSLREQTQRGSNGTSSCGNKASVRTCSRDVYIGIGQGLHKSPLEDIS